MNENNVNALYSNALSFLLNDVTTSLNETSDNFQYKLKQKTYNNNNVNTCSCMLYFVLFQVT